MKLNLVHPSLLLNSLRHVPYRVGRLAVDASGVSVGMGLSMILATVMPQFSLAQESNMAARQSTKFSRKDDLPLRADDKVQKNNLPFTGALAAITPIPQAELSKNGGILADVVVSEPKLNVKRLTQEELRELRQQLMQQP